MRGEALGGALPVRGIVYRAFPGPFQAGRRLDVGGYVLLKSFDSPEKRDEWVNENPGHREMVKADNRIVRKANRDFNVELPCEIPFMD